MIQKKSTSSFHKKAFAAITKDKNIWKRSTSGGAFSEIVRNYADNETLIAGAAWDGFKVHHICVIGFENIAPLCKSKYISSAIEDTFIEIRKHLGKKKKAIFCGCPCQVDGLKHFLMKDYENLLTIDFICHGQGSPLVFQECMKILGQELGAERFFLEVRKGNVAGRALYTSLGFVECGIRKGFYENPKEDAVLMMWEKVSQ